MENINDRIAASLAKAEKLERQAEQKARAKKLLENAEKKKQQKAHDALCFRVGNIVLACWPCVAQLQVHLNEDDNKNEFAPLKGLLLQIAASKQYITFQDAIASDTAMASE